MKTRRFITLLLAALLLLAFVPAFRAQAQTTTITYFTFSAAPDHLKDLDLMIAEFKKANAGIDVKVQTAPFADYFTLLQTDLNGGAGPDVFERNYEYFVTYAAKNVLLDLSSQTAQDKTWDAKAYYGRALEIFQQKGKQFGLPESFSTVVLLYNKALFDAAKVDYPKADWTWQDAIAAALFWRFALRFYTGASG